MSKKAAEPVVLKLSRKDTKARGARWPERSGSVDEIEVVDLVQYLAPAPRKRFVNEAYRVLKKGGKLTITAPHWCSARAYGDLDVQYPPVSEAWSAHLHAAWRKVNAPLEKGYTCDFDTTGGGYSLHPQIQARNQAYQMEAVQYWKEAAQDVIIVLSKRE